MRDQRGLRAEKCIRLRIIAVFGHFLIIVLVLLFLFDGFKLYGIDGDDFEIQPALRAGEDLALIYLILFHVQAGFALRTIKHIGLRSYDCTLLYLVSSGMQVKWSVLRPGF